eukprot:1708952-Prymnesium_polylepis.1
MPRSIFSYAALLTPGLAPTASITAAVAPPLHTRSSSPVPFAPRARRCRLRQLFHKAYADYRAAYLELADACEQRAPISDVAARAAANAAANAAADGEANGEANGAADDAFDSALLRALVAPLVRLASLHWCVASLLHATPPPPRSSRLSN